MWVLEIVATNSPPFRHTDLFKDSARMVICEELHVKAHSVLASCEMSSPSWKMLPSVQIGSLLRWSCLSPLLQKGGNELEAFLQVFFFLPADVVLDTSWLQDICLCYGLSCYPDVVAKMRKEKWEPSIVERRVPWQEEINSRPVMWKIFASSCRPQHHWDILVQFHILRT